MKYAEKVQEAVYSRIQDESRQRNAQEREDDREAGSQISSIQKTEH